jgi:hypothetical protein
MLKFELARADKHFNKPIYTAEKSSIFKPNKPYTNPLNEPPKNPIFFILKILNKTIAH